MAKKGKKRLDKFFCLCYNNFAKQKLNIFLQLLCICFFTLGKNACALFSYTSNCNEVFVWRQSGVCVFRA